MRYNIHFLKFRTFGLTPNNMTINIRIRLLNFFFIFVTLYLILF